MNKAILFLILLLAIPSVFACQQDMSLVDQAIGFCQEDNDGVCSGFENPFTSSECELGFEIMLQSWFIKIMLAILLYWAWKSKLYKNRSFMILVLILVFALLLFNTGEFKTESTPTTTTTSIPQNTSTLSGVVDSFMSWGDILWPSHPMLGWLIIISLFIVAVPVITLLMDNVENFLKRLI